MAFYSQTLPARLSKKEKLITDSNDILRDFCDGRDLSSLIDALVGAPGNAAVDLYSAAPVYKFELLQDLTNVFDFAYEIEYDFAHDHPTGFKQDYVPKSLVARIFGYNPLFTSKETVHKVLKELVGRLQQR